jgi:hypothetical protein
MNQQLGVVERELISVSKSSGVDLPTVLNSYAYINEAKVNCMELFEARKEEYDLQKLKNCVFKTAEVNKIYKEIDERISKI